MILRNVNFLYTIQFNGCLLDFGFFDVSKALSCSAIPCSSAGSLQDAHLQRRYNATHPPALKRVYTIGHPSLLTGCCTPRMSSSQKAHLSTYLWCVAQNSFGPSHSNAETCWPIVGGCWVVGTPPSSLQRLSQCQYKARCGSCTRIFHVQTHSQGVLCCARTGCNKQDAPNPDRELQDLAAGRTGVLDRSTLTHQAA